MSLVLVATVPTAPKHTPSRFVGEACPACDSDLTIVGKIDDSDVSHCEACDGWWVDESDDDTRARRTLASWRPYDEPEAAES